MQYYIKNAVLGACYDWYISFENNLTEIEDYYYLYCSKYDFTDSIIPDYSSSFTTNEDFDLIIEGDKVNSYLHVEQLPMFPGGDKARIKFLNENINYPEYARRKGIGGRVFVAFMVEKDGSLTNIEIVRRIGGGCDEEVVRVLNKMPNWKPARQFGEPVRVHFIMPILFRLNNGAPEINDPEFFAGYQLMSKEKYRNAIKYFDKSINNKADQYTDAYANRGICYYHLGEIEQALSDMDTATNLKANISPERAGNAYYNIALEFLKQKKYQQASDIFMKSINLNPSDGEAYYNMAVSHHFLGQSEKACEGWGKAQMLGVGEATSLIKKFCK